MWHKVAFAVIVVAQDPAPAPHVVDLTGSVTGALANETVRVTVWDYDMRTMSVDVVADGKADANGRFVLRGVPWVRDHAWGFHSMIVVARAGERAIGVLGLRGNATATDALVVSLAPAVSLSGVVKDDAGHAIADAVIEPWVMQKGKDLATQVLLGRCLFWRTTSDARGRFVVRHVPAGMQVGLYASHADFAERSVVVDDSAAAGEVVLQRGGTLTGRLRLPDGAPAPRARVAAQGFGGSTCFREVRTDDEGRYEIRSLPAGAYNVWAESDDYTVVALHAVRVDAGATVKGQDLVFVRGGFLVGRVVDVATGKPVQPGPDADVGMSGPARPTETGIQCVAVAADGTFRIRAPAGRNSIYLRPGRGWIARSGDGEFDVIDGKETVVEFRVARGGER